MSTIYVHIGSGWDAEGLRQALPEFNWAGLIVYVGKDFKEGVIEYADYDSDMWYWDIKPPKPLAGPPSLRLNQTGTMAIRIPGSRSRAETISVVEFEIRPDGISKVQSGDTDYLEIIVTRRVLSWDPSEADRRREQIENAKEDRVRETIEGVGGVVHSV